MAGNNPAPWLPGSIALLEQPLVEHTYAVKIWTGNLALNSERVEVPAYDVQVTLSSVQVPFGLATFKTPIPPWPGIDWPTGNVLHDLRSCIARIVPVSILAGWKTSDGGDDRHTILAGHITSIEVRRTADSSYVQWTVTSAEQLWEYPSHRTYNPSNSYTRLQQVTDAVNGSADPWYVAPVVTEGTLNTPSSGQLANFRDCDIAIGDTVGDYLRQLAQMLGQVIRPDWRNDTLRLKVETQPTYNTAAALILTSPAEASETYSYDEWGTILTLRAQWIASGDEKTSQRQFAATAVGGMPMFPNTPTRGTIPAVPQTATVWTKPPGGVVPADPTWAPTALWMDRITSKKAALLQATSRAAWWLVPGDVVTYTNLPTTRDATTTIVADTITYDLDNGLMTVNGYAP